MERESSLIEVSMSLKEDVKVLETAYANLVKDYQSLMYIPSTVHSNLRLCSLMCREQVKAQRDEKCSQIKFESVERFAEHLGSMIDVLVHSLEEKYNVK